LSDIISQVSSSIDALTQEFEIITHNLSNVSTAGYKRICNAFSRVLEAQQGQQSYNPGTIELNSALDFSQGGITETGRPMDFALYGKGFFVIETSEGPLYSRSGTFGVNQNGQIVDSEGRVVAGQAGPVTIPSGIELAQLHVSSDGNISYNGIAIGKFRLVDFKEEEGKLVPAGLNCYRMPEQDIAPIPAENLIVKQGCQEASNVKIIDELVDMIMVTRLYEANMDFIKAQRQTSNSIMSVAMA
jgi:flagellar basal-body rod protein FlgF